MNRKYKNNNYDISEFEHYKLVCAFREASEDAQRNNIPLKIPKLVDELMLSVIRKVQIETGVNYLRPGFSQSLSKFLNF